MKKYQRMEITWFILILLDIKLILMKVNSKVKFTEKGKVYQIVLEKLSDDVYKCPLLTDKGCILGSNKPFDCESWPYYIMKKDDEYVITISKDCPVINNIDENKLKEFAEKKMKDISINIIKKYPDMITNYNRDLKILYSIKKERID